MFPAFFNPRWSRAIARVAVTERVELVLCRDLPLAIPSIRVARRLRIPVVLDMAENYPAMLVSRWATGRMRWTDHLVRSPAAARQVERWVLPRLDGVLVMVDEARARLVRLGVPMAKIAVVSNTPPVSRLQARPAVHEKGQVRVVYLGLMEAQRGIVTLVDAVAALVRTGFPVQLTLVGDGPEASWFRTHIANLGLTDAHVAFLGRLPNDAALAVLSDMHIGVIPHHKDESWDTTVPNKLFDYMAAGLAVVTSDAAPAARIVRETACGRVFGSQDSESLAAALRELADPERRRGLGEAGRRAVEQYYHWERDVGEMLALLGRVTRAESR